MQTTIDFLNDVKRRHGLTSNYQLAKKLNVVYSAVVRYYKHNGTMDDAIALRVAALLGLDAGYVLSSVQAERAKRTEVRKVWEKIAAGLAALVLAIGLIAPPSPALAGMGSVYYVKWLRRWLRVPGIQLAPA